MNSMQYFIKASLSDDGKAKSKLYRTIALDGNKTLYNLAEWIVKSYDFDFDHPFGFYDNFKNPYNSVEGYELFADIGEATNFSSVKKNKINKVFTEVGKKLLFLFSYVYKINGSKLLSVLNEKINIALFQDIVAIKKLKK